MAWRRLWPLRANIAKGTGQREGPPDMMSFETVRSKVLGASGATGFAIAERA
jgi:hypothetical protein